jgi:hypothetical protein
MQRMEMDMRNLYRLRGFDVIGYVVWGCTVWANSASDARNTAASLIAQDNGTAIKNGLRPLPLVSRIVATKGGSHLDAVNSF